MRRPWTRRRSRPMTPSWPRDDAGPIRGRKGGGPMIDLTCWGCGYEGRIREHLAGLRVKCRWCRAINVVPDPVTRDDYPVEWLGDVEGGWRGALAESPTVVIPAYSG